MSHISRDDVKSQARSKKETILADPNARQLARDLARIWLTEDDQQAEESSTSTSRGNTDEYAQFVENECCPEWLQVEAFESRNRLSSLAGRRRKASRCSLIKNHYKYRQFRNGKATPNLLLAYPKLVKVAESMIRTNHPNRADAHVVLAFLNRYVDVTDHTYNRSITSVRRFTFVQKIGDSDRN